MQLNEEKDRILTRCINYFYIKDFAMYLEKKSEYNKGTFHLYINL